MRMVRTGVERGKQWQTMLAGDIADYEARLAVKRAARRGRA
jgi:hypothetical protein